MKEGYFRTPALRKLRKVAGGEVLTIIYLKMQLASLQHEGVLIHEGAEDTFAEELALVLDEDPDNVELTLAFLQKHKLIEQLNDTDYFLHEAVENIGSECDSAKRVRDLRARRASDVTL